MTAIILRELSRLFGKTVNRDTHLADAPKDVGELEIIVCLEDSLLGNGGCPCSLPDDFLDGVRTIGDLINKIEAA